MRRVSDAHAGGTAHNAEESRSLGAVTGITKAEERLISSVTAHLLAVERGASIVRVHDVKQMKEALTIYKAMVHYKDLK